MSRSSVFSLGVLGLAVSGLAVAGLAAPPQGAPPTKATPPARATPKPRPTPTPVPPRVLEGTVKGPDGKPVEGALVSAKPVLGGWEEPARTGHTDPAGHFKLDLASNGDQDLRVEARGLAASRLEKVRPGTSLTVTLGRGRTIEGIVRDDGGQPVAGARVTARSDRGLSASVWEAGAGLVAAVTDAAGRFRLEGIPPGLHDVAATARGYGEAKRRSIRPGTNTLILTLRSGGWITGRVVGPGGEPVKGAFMRAEQEPHFGASSSTETTDGDGRFEIPGLPAGHYMVIANAKGFAPGIETGVSVQDEGPVEVTVHLGAGGSVSGRIVDAQGHPLNGQARIQEIGKQQLPSSVGQVLKAETRDDGRFRIERVPAGSWALGITAAGFAGQRVEAEIHPSEPSFDLGDIVLDRGITLRGRVRTASGAPIAAASLDAYAYDDSGDEAHARSGDDGTFLLAGLQPGPYSVSVQATGFASLQKELSPGLDEADFVMSPGGAIAGLVVEEGDRPVDSYQVTARPDSADRRAMGSSKSVGNADGRFLLEDVAEGTYVLQVLAPERTPGSVSSLKVAAGRTTDAGVIRLSRGGVVRGTVVDAGGAAVSGATVKAVGPGDGRQRWMDLNAAVTDSAGGFEIQGVAPGNTTVGAGHPQYAPTETTVMVDPAKGPSEVRLTLQQGGRVEGSARRREGTPLPGLSVSVWERGRRQVVSSGLGGAVTAGDGSFVLEHVRPGSVEVSLMSDAGPGKATSVQGKTVEVREGETTVVEFVTREILVTGHTTRSGAPLPGLRIELWSGHMSTMHFGGESGVVPASPAGPQHMRAVSGDDGSFALIVDEPGRFDVNVTSLDGKASYPDHQIDIPDADTHVVELDFSGAPVTGVVVDKESEQPVATAVVIGQPKAPKAEGGAIGQTGSDGRFMLSLEPGDYTMRVRADRFAESLTDVAVGPAGVSDLRIALDKGLEIAGRVVDGGGRGVADLTIFATSEDDRSTALARTLADGSFRFGTLIDTAYNLCTGNEQAGYATRSDLKPGAKEVVLTLRPGGRVRLLVRGPDGAPLANAYPRVVTVGGMRVRIQPMGQSPSGATGIVELPAPAGTVEIEVRAEKCKGTLRVGVTEGATASAEITLTATPTP